MNNLNLDTCSRGVKDVPAWRGCKISIQGQLDECHPGSVFRLNRLKIRLLSRQYFSKINKSVSCLIVSAKMRLSRLLHLLLSVWRSPMEQIISLHSLDKLSPSCMFPSLALRRSASERTIKSH